MRQATIRRTLAVASATAMAGAALAVVGAGTASAESITMPGRYQNKLNTQSLEYERTVSQKVVTHGDTVTVTSKIIDSNGLWIGNTHYWIQDTTPACMNYVDGTARWKALGGNWESPSTKPREFAAPTSTAIRAHFNVPVSDPLELEAQYVVNCDAGQLASGGMSWNGTLKDNESDSLTMGPTITVNRAAVSKLFLATPASPTVGKSSTLKVETDAPEGSTISFAVDGQTLTGKVAGGEASTEWTPSSSGTKTVVATFAQTGTHFGKSTSRDVTVAAATVESTVNLTAPASAQVGVPVELSATVAPVGEGGTVTFKEQGQVVNSVKVSASGVVTTQWIPATEGGRSIDAEFSGRSGVAPSVAEGKLVNVAPKAADMESSSVALAPVDMTELGETIKLRATVDPASAGGKVSFYDGGTFIGEASVGENGVATLDWKPEMQGVRTVRAEFSGTDTVLPSQGTIQVTITSTTEPTDPTDPGTPGDGSGSLGSITGSLSGESGGMSSGSLSSLGG
ncbi:Ig-like domain-containing protein [Dietzia sp. ANT_WB102]|uniref:Ig-like domain-containing protein n=1 Tax=Dietzia sp. ANT_WB102 TaxID=2597345 RepID=UPI00165D5B0C|nr:Ig-like domain-containing protein [Dietzia sp. ANT_WB102]